MKKQETASGRRPSIPEVAVTSQEDSSITGKINLSVEEENALLRERNRLLENENALYREAFLRLYNATARQYSAKGRDEKKRADKYARTVEGLQPDDRPGYLASMGEVMIEALAEKPTPSPAVATTEGPDPLGPQAVQSLLVYPGLGVVPLWPHFG